MRDYARIACKVREATWLITPDGLSVVLGIIQDRMNNGKLSDEELEARLASTGFGDRADTSNVVNGVGIVPLMGPIFGKANLMTQLSGATSLEAFRTEFRDMMANDMVHTILLQVDSPGGTSDMVQEVADEIRAARDTKPIHAIADSMCGSAALWIASQANQLYATPSGSVGSFGAYTVHEDHSVADANAGVKFTYISAGKFKTEGNPHEPLSQEGKNYRQEVINELYSDFGNGLAAGRGKSIGEIEATYGDGRMLSAKKALDAGMIDGVMPLENLVGNLTSKPQRFNVSMSEQAAKAFGFDVATGIIAVVDANGVMKLEEKDWEHSEPGTGPSPVTEGDERNDPDITSGSRRDTPPAGFPGQEDNVMSDEDKKFLADLRAALHLSDDASQESVLSAATSLYAEVTPLREIAKNHEDKVNFAKQFPDQAAKMERLETRGRKADAHEFAQGYAQFSVVDDDGNSKATNKGFCAVVVNSIEDNHLKLAEGTFCSEDLGKTLDLIAKTGIVEYGERGHKTGDGDGDPSTETDARVIFGKRIEQYMASDNLDRTAALRMAVEKHPDEFEAYRKATPAPTTA